MDKQLKWVIKHLKHTYKTCIYFLGMVLVTCLFSSFASDLKRSTTGDVKIRQDQTSRSSAHQLQETPQKPSSDKLLKPIPKSDDRSRKKSRSRQPSKAKEIKLPGHLDVSIKKLRLNKKRCRPGEKIQAYAEILNQGNQDLRNLKVRFHLGKKRINRDQTISMRAGKKRRVSTTFKAPVRGRHQVTAMVDPDNRIPETNERNNMGETPLEVLPQKGRKAKPNRATSREVENDLEIVKLTLNRSKTSPGQKITIEAKIINRGSKAVKGVPLRFSVEKEKIGRDQLIRLNAGQTRSYRASFKAGKPGKYSILSLIDPKGRLSEKNKRNNSKSVTLLVQSAGRKAVQDRRVEKRRNRDRKKDDRVKPETLVDLEIIDLTLKPQTVAPGQKVTVTARIRNNSRNKAGKVAVRFKLEEKNIMRDKIIDLSDSGPVKVEATFKPEKTGDHSVFAILDPDRKQPDPKRKNNYKNAVLHVRELAFEKSKDKTMTPVSIGLDISKPTSGNYYKGGILPITWKAAGLPKTTQYKFGLKHVAGGSKTITISCSKPSIPDQYNEIWCEWDIPETFNAGSYRVKVSTTDNKYFAISKPFKITGGGIEILYPNSKSEWNIGGTFKINWKADVFKWKDPKKQLQKYKNSKAAEIRIQQKGLAWAPPIKITDIADFVATDIHPWTIGGNVKPGWYWLRIESKDGMYSCTSDPFKIVSSNNKNIKGIIVDAPIIGSVWPHGSKMTIMWGPDSNIIKTGKQIDQKVNIIMLDNYGAKLKTIHQDVTWSPPFKSTYTWTVPSYTSSSNDPLGDYIIEVKTTDGNYYGRSGKFLISSKYKNQGPGYVPPTAITITSPVKGEVWPVNSSKPLTIKWNRTGKMNSKVNIIVYIPKGPNPSLKDNPTAFGAYLLKYKDRPNTGSFIYTKSGFIPPSMNPYSGEAGGPVRVRVETIDHKYKDDSEVFYIGDKNEVQIISPPEGGVTYTGKTLAIQWKGAPTDLSNWDVYLLAKKNKDASAGGKKVPSLKPEIVWIKKNFMPLSEKNSYKVLYTIPQKLKPGNYELKVVSKFSSLWSASKTIKIKSNLIPTYSFDKGKIAPSFQSIPELPDFEIVKLKAIYWKTYQDKIKFEIHNKGAAYSGNIGIGVDIIKTKGADKSKLVFKPAKSPQKKYHDKTHYVNFFPNEKKVFEIDLYAKDELTYINNAERPKYGPFTALVTVSPMDEKDHDLKNNSKSIDICRTECGDLVSKHSFAFKSGSTGWRKFYNGDIISEKSSRLKWISKDTFSAYFSARIFNFGCNISGVVCKLWVKKSPSKKTTPIQVATFTLLPGESKDVGKWIKIRLPGYTPGIKGQIYHLTFKAERIDYTCKTPPNVDTALVYCKFKVN